MLGKIRHVAIYTDKYEAMVRFYRTIFGMRQITTGTVDESGKQNPNRGHISDGVIGLALLPRYAGIPTGIDHFGFEAEDVEEVLRRLRNYYPEILVARALENVPFAGLRTHDPAGAQFDLSQQGMNNVREGYTRKGWEQPRRLSHISIRTYRPAAVAEFYKRVFDLEEIGKITDDGALCLTDGQVKLLLRPCENRLYRGLREGLDHMGFRVENLSQAERDLEALAASAPESAPRKIAVGRHGQMIEDDLKRCPLGARATADPDGTLLHLSAD
ncbi:MAG TPA: VOC family protein [Candidatus Acidoferrales bacterium]|nr:VOC family protein [Candidatus Acidoferrales bacterium]